MTMFDTSRKTIVTNWRVVERYSHTVNRQAQFVVGGLGLRGARPVRTSAITHVDVIDGIPTVRTVLGVYELLGENQGTAELTLGKHG